MRRYNLCDSWVAISREERFVKTGFVKRYSRFRRFYRVIRNDHCLHSRFVYGSARFWKWTVENEKSIDHRYKVWLETIGSDKWWINDGYVEKEEVEGWLVGIIERSLRLQYVRWVESYGFFFFFYGKIKDFLSVWISCL